jgi:hypothetical protein
MTVPSSTPVRRPFADRYLTAYSAEHIVYEIDMFFWLAELCGNALPGLAAPSAADTTRLRNALIEAFVVHFRNLIDFLYLDKLMATDVVADDFFPPGAWGKLRPAITSNLEAARIRANKEIAHLTTERMAGSPPKKAWDFQGLASEIRPLLRLVAAHALGSRLSPNVASAIR